MPVSMYIPLKNLMRTYWGIEIFCYNLQVHIVYLGERQHNDPELVRDSHHDMLASIVGRYNKRNYLYFSLDLLNENPINLFG